MTSIPADSSLIPASELSRIVASLDSASSQRGPAKDALALHHQSRARVASWTNTLEGQRKQLDRERELKLEREEGERQRIDVKEAEIQLADRRKIIERANALLAKESDRVKTFSSAMMLSDVLKEREQQVIVKTELDKLERIREQRYADLNHMNYRKLLERELREKHQLQEKAKNLQHAQKTQLEESKHRRISEIEDSMMEGELLRKKAEEDLMIELEKSIKRKQIAINNLKQTQKANHYLQQVKGRELIHSMQEDERIKQYAEEKQKIAELRKQKERELFEKKQAARNAMIAAQQKKLEERMNKEEDRVNREVKERDEELAREHQNKIVKMRRWQQEIDHSRQAQIAHKHRAAAQAKAEDTDNATKVKELARRLENDEKDEINERKSAYRRIAMEQLQQAALRKKHHEEEQRDEREVVKEAKNALMADMLDFHRFAEGVIRDYATDGKNVIPLIKQLRSYKKGLTN